MTTKTKIAIGLWLAAIGLAMCFDSAIAIRVQRSGIDEWLRSHHLTAHVIKWPGTYACTIPVALVAGLTHAKRSLAGWFVILATMLSGGINFLSKWMVGRSRPFKLDQITAQPFILSPFRGGIHGFMRSENLCFPSGHTSLAFATAAAVAMLWPQAKWRWIGYAVASIIAIERVLENSHWASDAVAGAALGLATVHLTTWILTKVKPPAQEQLATVS